MPSSVNQSLGNSHQAVIIGCSWGGLDALAKILTPLPKSFPVPILVVQHLHAHSDGTLVRWLNDVSAIEVKEASEKELVQPGIVYIGPPNYHFLIETDRTISFSISAPVNYSRPSIDVLFESASDVYKEHLIGIILTGANDDGSRGLKKVKERGGYAIVQDPKTAQVATMPLAAIRRTQVDKILPLGEIGHFLMRMMSGESDGETKKFSWSMIDQLIL